MVAHAIVHNAAPTAAPPQTQNYTKTGLGEPKAVIALATNVETLSADVPSLSMSIGATDFTTEGVAHANELDNDSPTDNNHIHQSDHIVHLPNPEGTFGGEETAVENGTITDGVQLSWDLTNAAKQCSLIMLNEGIANAYCENVQVGTSGDKTITPGFQADIVVVISAGVNNTTGQTDAEQCMGFYERIGNTYVCIGWRTSNGRDLSSVVTTTAQGIKTTDIGLQINTIGSFGDNFTIGNFTSTEFDMQRANGSADRLCCVLALKLDAGYNASVGTFNAPLADGVTDVITGLTGTPELAMFLAVNADAVGSSGATCSFMVGACTDAEEVAVNGWSEDARSVASNCGQAHRDDSCIYITDDAANLQSQASFSAFSDGKVTLDFTQTTNDILIGYLVISRVAFGEVINRVLTETTVITDPVPGSLLKKERAANSNVDLLVDAMFLYTAHARLVQDNFSVGDQYVIGQNLDRALSEAVSVEDALAIFHRSFREISEVISLDDALLAKNIYGRVQADLLSLVDTSRQSITRSQLLPDGFAPTDLFQKVVTIGEVSQTFVVLLDDLVFVDDVVPIKKGNLVRQQTDTISVDEFIALSTLRQSLFVETLLVEDSLAFGRTKNQLDANDSLVVTDNDASFKKRNRSVVDGFADTQDNLIQQIIRGHALLDDVQMTDSIAVKSFRLFDVILADDIDIADDIEFQKTGIVKKQLSDALLLTDSDWFETGSTLQPSVEIQHGIEAQ